MANQYRVNVVVQGSLVRPSYSGYVEVYAENDTEAAAAAKRKLKRTSFQEVSISAFKVKSVERRYR